MQDEGLPILVAIIIGAVVVGAIVFAGFIVNAIISGSFTLLGG
jgi:hypothetical protein